jgi:AGZA family xanthine/uracil permease-like MFS transporter
MLKEYFKLEQRHTNLRTEIVAGVTTFLTMAYIIFVNPAILSTAGMDKQALIIVTCVVSGVMTIVTGLFGNAPIAMAPGMGLNAFLSYSLVLGGKITWQAALGVVFLSGLLCWLLTLLGLRKRLVEAIPVSLVSAISVGIGLYITFIGLQDLGMIVKNEATLVSAGPLTWTVAMGLCGLLLMAFLAMKKVQGALLIGMIFSTVLAVAAGFVQRPTRLVSLDFDITPVAFQLDILGALK